MRVDQVMAGIAVADTEAAAKWYERLLGRPADARPMDGLVDWYFESAGVLQLVADPRRAGGSTVTVVVGDGRAALAEIAARGIDVGALDETTSDKVLFVTFDDPDGNAVTVVEQRPAPDA